MDFAGGLIGQAPIPSRHATLIAGLSMRLDALAMRVKNLHPEVILAGDWDAAELADKVRAAKSELLAARAEMVALQEELDWIVYASFGLVADEFVRFSEDVEPIRSEHRPFAIRLARLAAAGERTYYWFDAMEVPPVADVPEVYSADTRKRIEKRLSLIGSDANVARLESPECKRKWEPLRFDDDLRASAFSWLADRLENVFVSRSAPLSLPYIVGAVQDDARFLAVASMYAQRVDVELAAVVGEILASETVPSHPYHTYTESGITKRAAWEIVWEFQRREDAGERGGVLPPILEYSQGSRGKSTDYLRTEYWHLRGKLDVPRERFIAFTEVPGRVGVTTLYGWAGWTPLQRLKAVLAIDEELDDDGVALADRAALLDSAWRLLPDVGREDAQAAARLRAELQALVGSNGPSREMLEDWRKRFPPPKAPKKTAARARKTKQDEEDDA